MTLVKCIFVLSFWSWFFQTWSEATDKPDEYQWLFRIYFKHTGRSKQVLQSTGSSGTGSNRFCENCLNRWTKFERLTTTKRSLRRVDASSFNFRRKLLAGLKWRHLLKRQFPLWLYVADINKRKYLNTRTLTCGFRLFLLEPAESVHSNTKTHTYTIPNTLRYTNLNTLIHTFSIPD